MNTAFIIFGILFFAALSLYNLIHSFKHKKSYLPSIFGFLICLSTALVLYEQPLMGGFVFLIILLLAILSSRTILAIRKSSLLKAIDGVEITSTFSTMHILDIRFWAAYALKNGAKKAAIGYSLSQTGLLLLVLAIVMLVSPSYMKFHVWMPFVFVSFVMGLRDSNEVFREFCGSKI
ncbi:hypothetical protein [Methanococcoides alaskense]|uniref:Uncharacterized protein n=1 Tax=Methanococcoides alaskense TaxID=325778 RepID=A0AA90TYG5_9EURY|nr:hypothetical protein [Methanococcoides alaskense]MDA0524879.1 hypothetical protein [Methanococcoides alaskense]MDR6222207.1 hypothetical protein [Methanococcoides alaskense]